MLPRPGWVARSRRRHRPQPSPPPRISTSGEVAAFLTATLLPHSSVAPVALVSPLIPLFSAEALFTQVKWRLLTLQRFYVVLTRVKPQ